MVDLWGGVGLLFVFFLAWIPLGLIVCWWQSRSWERCSQCNCRREMLLNHIDGRKNLCGRCF
jgi:hypothetical protein